MKVFEETADMVEGEARLERRVQAHNIMCRLAEIAVAEVSLMETLLVEAGDGTKCVAQDGPTDLQDFVFDRRERHAGEPNRRVGEVPFGNGLEIAGEYADLFELARSAGDGGAGFS